MSLLIDLVNLTTLTLIRQIYLLHVHVLWYSIHAHKQHNRNILHVHVIVTDCAVSKCWQKTARFIQSSLDLSLSRWINTYMYHT